MPLRRDQSTRRRGRISSSTGNITQANKERKRFVMKGGGVMRLLIATVLVARAALADAVTDWNRILLGTISAEAPQAQTRFAAITHLAVFEAVNAIAGH